MSRNPLGARLPPTEPTPPRILADGSEEQHHGGSIGMYMAHKNRKLQEQFQAQAAVLPGQQRTQLFKDVSIHCNGFTNPSHAELKQLMALHSGRFEVYYSRNTVTHVICSNLPDAKVKQLQKERSPTPVVRPEWIVDSIKAGRVLPIEDYVLWQLRDAPGQQKLKAFMQVQPAELPPSAIYGGHAGAVGSAVEQLQAVAAPAATPDGLLPAGATSTAAGAALDGHPGSPTFSFDVRTQQQRIPPPDFQQELFQQSLQQQQQQQPAAELTFAPHGQPGRSAMPQVAAPSPGGAALLLQGSARTGSPHGMSVAGAAAQAATHGARPVSPTRFEGDKSGLRYSHAGYDAEEMQRAQQIASKMRAECDMLKGPPRSSKDDPKFVDSYFRASRLHYIGTYKSRIEALMASSAGSEGPSPAPHAPGRQRTIVHLDMDCFFAAVAEAENPVFKGKPLAVCHSASSRGTGEVSTSNYEARKYGVRSGMMISQAKELCPQLVVVPYLFEQYASVSEKVYRILLQRTACVQPLSCDEAYLDITGLGDPLQLAAEIRAEIEATTGCTASAGVGPNLLLARIATESAKPNGQMMVTQQQADQFLQGLDVSKLPGVGWATGKRLAEHDIHSVADVQARSKQFLQMQLGAQQGAMLWDFAHGKDKRQVEPPRARKSVGAEVNWGVRFQSVEQSREFLHKLAVEVQDRLGQAGAKGRTLTLKLMRRKPGAPEPVKHMGHGICDNLSRSVTLASATDSSKEIASHCWQLLCALKVPFADIRGMGITVTRLNTDIASSSVRPGAALPARLAPAAAGQRDAFVAFFKKDQPSQVSPQQAQQGHMGEEEQQHHQQQREQQQQQQHKQDQALGGNLPPRQQQDVGQQQVVQQQMELAHSIPRPQALAASPGSAKKSPDSARQARLETVLPRQAAASPAAEDAERRQQLLHEWQGVSLSQMDASVLDALPWSVRKELIEAAAQRNAHHFQERQKQVGRPLAGCFEEAAAAQGAGGLRADGSRPLAEIPGPEEQDEQAPQPQLSSDGEDGWETNSQLAGADEAAAAGTPPPHGLAAQEQQQHASNASGESRAFAGGSSGGTGGTSVHIVALPALSQVDRSVLDALPLLLRRELEHAYGIGRARRRLPPAGPAGRRGDKAGHHGGAGSGGLLRHVSKRQRIDSFVSNPPPLGITGSGRALAAAAAARREQQMSLSQVDPSVLAELPPEVRHEVVQQLQQDDSKQHTRRQHRSRLGQQHDEERAWQQRWEEERQQQGLEEAELAAVAGGTVCGLVSRGMNGAGLERQQVDADLEQLPDAVQQFLQAADVVVAEARPNPASSLAAALAECLQQLPAQLDGDGDGVPAPRLRSPSPSQEPGSRSRGSRDAPPGSSGGSSSMDVDVPPTQLVGVDGHEVVPAEEAAAPPLAGSDRLQPSPQLPSLQQDGVQAVQRQAKCREGSHPIGSGASSSPPGSGFHRPRVQQGVQALGSSIQHAAAALLANRDLEQLRLLLLAVRRLAQRHVWFATTGGAAVDAAQARVQEVYGWRLRLEGLDLSR